MPQFDPEWFASQLFWLIVTFTALYFVLSRVALPRIAQVLEERQDKVDDDLAKAERLKEEAEEVHQAYEQTLADARAEAQKALKETADQIAREQSAHHETLTAELQQKTREAEERIAAAKTEAIDELRTVAGEVAQAAAQKLIGTEVGKGRAEKAVKQAMEGTG